MHSQQSFYLKIFCILLKIVVAQCSILIYSSYIPQQLSGFQSEGNKMKKFNFSANGLDFGNYEAADIAAAQEIFAIDNGYKSWLAMVEQAEEFGGNTVEIEEI